MTEFDASITQLLQADARFSASDEGSEGSRTSVGQVAQELADAVKGIQADARSIKDEIHKQVLYSPFAFSLLTSVLVDACILLGPNSTVVALNSAARALFAVGEGSEFVGKHVDVLLNSVSPGANSAQKELVVYDGIAQAPRYFEVSKHGAATPEASQLEILMLRDITARKRLELKSLDLSHFQQSLLSSMPLPVFYTDNSGRYIRGSERFYSLTGWSPVEAISKSWLDLIPERPPHVTFSAESPDWVKPVRFDASVVSPKGLRQAVVLRNAIAQNADTPSGFIGVILLQKQQGENQ